MNRTDTAGEILPLGKEVMAVVGALRAPGEKAGSTAAPAVYKKKDEVY